MKFFRGLINAGLLALLIYAVAFLCIAPFTCRVSEPGVYFQETFTCEASEYETYAGDLFARIHYGELDNVLIDTVQVLSITIRGETIEARIVGSKQPIYIKYPDRLEKVCPN